MQLRTCTKCESTYPNTEEFFYRNSPQQLKSRCKACCKKESADFFHKSYGEDKERYVKRALNYIKNNKERIKLYEKNQYAQKSETLKEKSRAYYESNKGAVIQRVKNYRHEHREAKMYTKIKRRFNLKAAGAEFSLEEWNLCMEYFNNECCYCNKKCKLTQDHVVPISNGGTHHKSNIVPACINCNSSKGVKEYLSWYRIQKFYSQQNETSIVGYLNNFNK
jgi:5-methylcytosine-specific restriction endonuclease McrA